MKRHEKREREREWERKTLRMRARARENPFCIVAYLSAWENQSSWIVVSMFIYIYTRERIRPYNLLYTYIYTYACNMYIFIYINVHTWYMYVNIHIYTCLTNNQNTDEPVTNCMHVWRTAKKSSFMSPTKAKASPGKALRDATIKKQFGEPLLLSGNIWILVIHAYVVICSV